MDDQPQPTPMPTQPPIEPTSTIPPTVPPAVPSTDSSTIPPTDNPTASKKDKSTIKVVIIVLAVALLPFIALISIMCFGALPAMQMSQRNSQRKNDYFYLSTKITDYITKNGSLPDAGATLNPKEYINSTGTDPSNKTYIIKVVDCDLSNNCPGTLIANASEVYIVRGAKCDGVALVASNQKRSFAIIGYLEGESQLFCTYP